MIKNGVPFDTAHHMAGFSHESHDLDVLTLAYSVVFGEFEGGIFQWSSMSWKKN